MLFRKCFQGRGALLECGLGLKHGGSQTALLAGQVVCGCPDPVHFHTSVPVKLLDAGYLPPHFRQARHVPPHLGQLGRVLTHGGGDTANDTGHGAERRPACHGGR